MAEQRPVKQCPRCGKSYLTLLDVYRHCICDHGHEMSDEDRGRARDFLKSVSHIDCFQTKFEETQDLQRQLPLDFRVPEAIKNALEKEDFDPQAEAESLVALDYRQSWASLLFEYIAAESQCHAAHALCDFRPIPPGRAPRRASATTASPSASLFPTEPAGTPTLPFYSPPPGVVAPTLWSPFPSAIPAPGASQMQSSSQSLTMAAIGPPSSTAALLASARTLTMPVAQQLPPGVTQPPVPPLPSQPQPPPPPMPPPTSFPSRNAAALMAGPPPALDSGMTGCFPPAVGMASFPGPVPMGAAMMNAPPFRLLPLSASVGNEADPMGVLMPPPR